MNVKTEGGSGGKRGHSNMNHWQPTEEIKAETKRQRRIQNGVVIREQLNDIKQDKG